MANAPETLPDVAENWRRASAFRHDFLLVCAAVVAISAVVLLWFVLTHRRRQRHSRHHSGSRQFGMNPGAAATGDAAVDMPQRRKWRRRRRDHRPRNPTLAETGGLPPVRPDGPPQTGL